MFNQQVFVGLRNRRRTNHFVAQSVSYLGGVDLEWQPSGDILNSGFFKHVTNRIAHAQVGRYGSVVNPFATGSTFKHRENVGRGSADVHTENVDAFLNGVLFQQLANGVWCRHNFEARPIQQSRIARSLLHDVLEEHLVNLFTSWTEVLGVQSWSQVVDNLGLDCLAKDLFDLFLGEVVAREDDR